MKWICRKTMHELFQPYLKKTWIGPQTIEDALKKCACYSFFENGKKTISIAVEYTANNTCYIVAAVSAVGRDWQDDLNKALLILCKNKKVTMHTKKKSPLKKLNIQGWAVSKVGNYYELKRQIYG